jgi:ribosomal-protein-alanine N-acetyltransferase
MTISNLIVRPATFQDIPSILAIEQKATSYPIAKTKIESEFEQENAHILIAEHEDKAVGYLDVWIVLSEAEIINVAVDPDFQKQGIGRSLFHYFAQNHPGIKKIHLEVRAGNLKAQKFYQKLGFQTTGRRKSYYADGEDAVLMFAEKIG